MVVFVGGELVGAVGGAFGRENHGYVCCWWGVVRYKLI